MNGTEGRHGLLRRGRRLGRFQLRKGASQEQDGIGHRADMTPVNITGAPPK